ncbi:hypothetical protein LWC34_11355 [Kibdelosporangium philippinense]|uniref:Secreted protein n=1 Tax=Kibdelosporangium philippinense TaxID=211113 RepID=A0ABS8Z6C6_9PSEU|nr:hypothetical protein [Kibdelosporangium philippinense]MCE7003420.1 hypothetical protein [Kibdelosporangium philippinense]
MWICLVLVLGLIAFAATRRNARKYPEVEHVPRPESTCVAMRSHYIPEGTRRPSGRRQRAHYAAPRR